MKKFLAYLKGWRGLALITYMWLILMAYVIVYVDVTSVEMKRRFYILSVAEVILIALTYVCPRLLNWAENLSLKPYSEELAQKHKQRFFLKTWLATFAVFFVMYLIFYPGGFSGDDIAQYHQAMGLAKYNDWHPVLSTLFSYTLPLRLTGNWQGSAVLFQAIIFSLSLAYMAVTVFEYGSYKYAKRFVVYIMLNPATLAIYMTRLKDSSFSIAMLVLMTFAVRVYFTNGRWLQSILRTALFVVVIAAGTLFRHNAILFTLPLWFAVSMYIRKRHALLILVCFLGLVYTIRYPLYESLNVQRPGQRQVETLGLPVTIIGNAVKEAPERLDKDILDFAYSIAPAEIWREKFNVVNGFIGVKNAFAERARNEAERKKLLSSIRVNSIEDTGWRKILDMTVRCFREAPLASLRGALGCTSLVYGIAGPPLGRIIPSIAPNKLGLSNNKFLRLDFIGALLKKVLTLFQAEAYKTETGGTAFKFGGHNNDEGNFTLQSLIILCYYAVMVLFKHVFWCIGVLNLAVIIFILARLDFSKVSGWKRLFLVMPMLAHNFGTMLLLQANDFRYFYYSYLVIPLVILVLLRDNSEVQS